MGWNQPKNTRESNEATRPSLPLWVRGFLAAAIVVVGAVGAWWWVTSGNDAKPKAAKSKPSAKIAEAKPVRSAAPVSEKKTEEKADDEKWEDAFERIPEKRHKFSKLETVTTSSCGVINERWRMPNGKYWRRQVDPPPLFDNPSDNAIATVLGQRAGTPMPHYPGLDDADLNKEFAKSLLKPIEIGEDDKPWLVALKMSVKEARAEIARMIKEGDPRSVGEILRDHVEENNRQADLTADALKGYNQVLSEDGEEAAAEYLEKVNKALEGYGVAPIKARGTANVRKRK